jgi:RNA methyltransferase, TrmH family
MLSKTERKYIQSLSQKKFREQHQVFLVEGPKIVEELLLADQAILKVYATKDWVDRNQILVLRHQALIEEISTIELSRISQLNTPNEVLATVRMMPQKQEPNLHALIIALDDLQDPGNLGTIIRLADWFGIQQIVCSNNTVDQYNPKVVQSSMGSFVRTQIWYKDLPEWLSQQNEIYGAVLDGESLYAQTKITQGTILIGNESKGINESLKKLINHPITIPRKGGAESLNAAMATAIILSHLT